jgi:hypothetical protein
MGLCEVAVGVARKMMTGNLRPQMKSGSGGKRDLGSGTPAPYFACGDTKTRFRGCWAQSKLKIEEIHTPSRSKLLHDSVTGLLARIGDFLRR